MTEPSWRKPVGLFAIIGWIALWSVIITSFAGSVGHWPVLVQAIFYFVAGTAWILPLKPVLQWIETGRFRR